MAIERFSNSDDPSYIEYEAGEEMVRRRQRAAAQLSGDLALTQEVYALARSAEVDLRDIDRWQEEGGH